MQHHDERHRLPAVPARDVELVSPASGRIGVRQGFKACALGQRGWRMGRHGPDQSVKAGWQARGGAELSDAVQEVTQCVGHTGLSRSLSPVESLVREVRPEGLRCTPTPGASAEVPDVNGASDAVLLASMRCRSAVASVSRSERVRWALSRLASERLFMTKAFCCWEQGKRPRSDLWSVSRVG